MSDPGGGSGGRHSPDDAGIEDLVARGDPDELLLEVDRRCARRDWAGLLLLRDRCAAAIESGRQLWGVAQFAEYRVALEAPGRYAAGVCRTGAGRFALGPLTEVAAQSHTWDELADHLGEPWIAATVAQERVLRGEDLRDDPRAHADELSLPMTLQPWEPRYPLPTYRSHDLVEGGPDPLDEVEFRPVQSTGAPLVRLPKVERALADVVATWVERSNGAVDLAVVEGDATDAVAALVDVARAAPITLADALARLAWAAGSGGSHGRRSGMAAGRSRALWVLHAVTGRPFDTAASEVGAAAETLEWYAFATDVEAPWSLRLAVADPQHGWAAAVDARDRRVEDGADATST